VLSTWRKDLKHLLKTPKIGNLQGRSAIIYNWLCVSMTFIRAMYIGTHHVSYPHLFFHRRNIVYEAKTFRMQAQKWWLAVQP